jgi:hypothetical protein
MQRRSTRTPSSIRQRYRLRSLASMAGAFGAGLLLAAGAIGIGVLVADSSSGPDPG